MMSGSAITEREIIERLRSAIIVASGSGLDYIGREMLGVMRTAELEIDFARWPGVDGAIGTFTAVETDDAYRQRILGLPIFAGPPKGALTP
jgi:hypothetical protein